jgi:hypothetical protein
MQVEFSYPFVHKLSIDDAMGPSQITSQVHRPVLVNFEYPFELNC